MTHGSTAGNCQGIDPVITASRRHVRKSTVIFEDRPVNPMAPDIATAVGSIQLERPAILASGILGISTDVFARLHKAGAGAVVTKSVSSEPWDGYPNPTVFGVGGGGWLNAVGLSNPGARNFAEMIRTAATGAGDDDDRGAVPIIVSLVGSAEGEFESMIDEFDGCRVTAYEINLSCPHVARVGLDVGDDPDLVTRIMAAVKKKAAGTPVLAKVGLGTTHYIRTVGSAIEGGADGITAINTIRAMAIDAQTQRPILSNKIGGLSGTPIKPVALRCVYEIASRYDTPVVGCGGISTWEDAVEFILAGACAVQVGSAMGGDGWLQTFERINAGIASYMEQKGYSRLEEMVGLAQGS